MRLVSVSGRVRRISPCVRSTISKYRRTIFLPLPATQERGEDRGEGYPRSLLSPALSSIRWRRGSLFGFACAARSSFLAGGSFVRNSGPAFGRREVGSNGAEAD